jgi:hypothetical protein
MPLTGEVVVGTTNRDNQTMLLLRLVALIVLFCVAALAPGWASAHTRHNDVQSSAMSPAAPVVAQPAVHTPSMMAVTDQDDADCDGDGCTDGHCKHGCSCGCGMATCAGSCSALVGQPWMMSWSGAKQSLAPLVTQHLVATRSTSPLRPPIA